MRLLALAALLALAGCLSTPGEPAPGGTSGPAAGSSTTASGAPSTEPGVPYVAVDGTLFRDGARWWANLTARNTGDRTLGWSAPFCASPPGWTARLSGPPGNGLAYRHADARMGCPAKAGAMPPGAWLNWTWDGGAGRACTVDTVCHNVWDGRLRDCEACAQEPYPAPPGDYVWTFTFAYHEAPGEDLGEGQHAMPRSPRHEAHVTLRLDVA